MQKIPIFKYSSYLGKLCYFLLIHCSSSSFSVLVSRAVLKCNNYQYSQSKVSEYLCCNELCSSEPSPALPVDLFEKVNIKVDGSIEDRQEVAEASDVLHPGWPVG